MDTNNKLEALTAEVDALADKFYHRQLGKAGNILLVDDNTRLYLPFRKKFINFNVFTAENGIKALDVVAQEAIDLAIVDMKMPEMDGVELIDIMYRLKPDLNVVVFTAFHEEYDEKKLRSKYNILDYFRKPSTLADIFESVQSIQDAKVIKEPGKDTLKRTIIRTMVDLQPCPVGKLYLQNQSTIADTLQQVNEQIEQGAITYCGIGHAINTIEQTSNYKVCGQCDVSKPILIEKQQQFSCNYHKRAASLLHDTSARITLLNELKQDMAET